MSDYDPMQEPEGRGPQPLRLPGERLRVLGELERLGAEAAEIYEGGLWVLAQPANPKRGRLAAGAMRELVTELGKIAGVVRTRGLVGRVRELQVHWQKVSRTGDGGVAGETIEIAGRLEVFFKEVDEEYPRARERMAQTLRGLDAIGASLAPEAEERRIDTLMEIDARFGKALHGSSRYGVAEIEREINRLGDLILALRLPPVASDLASIDDLLSKGPPDG
jgi:hypothetical protein